MPLHLPLLRRAARLTGVLIAGAYTLLMIGEIATPHSGGPSTLLEWSGIVLLTVAAFALLFAWRWELGGGLISLAALALQAALIRGSHTYHLVLLIMAIPGVLFCADWLVRRPNHRTV